MNNIINITIFCALLLSSLSSNAAEHSLKFAVVIQEDTALFRKCKAVLRYISAQINIPITLEYLPPKRAQQRLKSGEIDAELSRVASYQSLMPKAIKVAEPIASFPIYVYSVDKQFVVKGWDSLLPYSILTVRAWVYAQKNMSRHNTIQVDSQLQAFKMLKAGRADLFATGLVTADNIFSTPGFKRGNIIRLEPAVTYMHTFTYFSAQHTALAKTFSHVLKEMKSGGIYQKIMRETL